MRPVSRRVLVVNDDVRLAESVRQLLCDSGYEAAVAWDGQHALDVLAEWPAELVLLDLIMPRLDGWGFLQRLASSAQPSASRPRVLVWSVAGPDDLVRAQRLGAAECLPRASTGPDELLDAVARMLDNRPPGERGALDRAL